MKNSSPRDTPPVAPALTAFDEIQQHHVIGSAGYTMILKSIRSTGARRNYPPPEGHTKWTNAAAREWCSDVLFVKKGTELLTKLGLLATDQDSLQRLVDTTVLNVFRDTARATEVGKVAKRLRGILDADPRIVSANILFAGTRAWSLPGNGEEIYTGDWAELLVAPALRNLEPLEKLNPSGPTSAANKRRFGDAATALLQFASGALTEIDLAKAIVKMFELENVDMFLLREDDQSADVYSVRGIPGKESEEVAVAEVIWADLTDAERVALPHLDEDDAEFVKSCPSIANPTETRAGLREKLLGHNDLYRDLPGALGIVIARCRDYAA